MLKNSSIRILAALACGAFGFAAMAQEPNQDLHSMAQRAGGKLILHYMPDHSVRYPNIDEIARRSDLIIVGRVVMNRPRLRADGKFVTQSLWVRVQEVVKGQAPFGGAITVIAPGGAYRFSDGSLVFVDPRASNLPQVGHSYVFFLQNYGSVYRGHELVGGYQGMYDLTGGGVGPADTLAGDPVITYYKGMNAGQFLALLHASVRSVAAN